MITEYIVDTKNSTITFYLFTTCSMGSHQPKIAEELIGNMEPIIDTGGFKFRCDQNNNGYTATYPYYGKVPTPALIENRYKAAQAIFTKAIDEVLRFKLLLRILNKVGERWNQ
jgi:hypothetical protein